MTFTRSFIKIENSVGDIMSPCLTADADYRETVAITACKASEHLACIMASDRQCAYIQCCRGSVAGVTITTSTARKTIHQ